MWHDSDGHLLAERWKKPRFFANAYEFIEQHGKDLDRLSMPVQTGLVRKWSDSDQIEEWQPK